MKKYSLTALSAAFWFLALMLIPSFSGATQPEASPPYDYSKPRLLTGTLYAIGSDRQKVLYKFKRTAVRNGNTVHVERQFLLPNGTLAAVETVVYHSGQMVSFEMKDFQAHLSGAVRIQPVPKNPAGMKIYIGFGHGLHPPQGRAARLQPRTVIDDTLYPFMIEHWDQLMRGRTVRFHFVSLDWERTFVFGLTKTGESEKNGEPVVTLTMKPASMFVSAFVRPIIFTVQAKAPHLILSYVGRTTPRVKKGNSWKELDAETVFDYPAADNRQETWNH